MVVECAVAFCCKFTHFDSHDGFFKVVENALALQEAGCFSIVLECLPPLVSAAVTSALHIPTIGIGAGPNCSGQVLKFTYSGFFKLIMAVDTLHLII